MPGRAATRGASSPCPATPWMSSALRASTTLSLRGRWLIIRYLVCDAPYPVVSPQPRRFLRLQAHYFDVAGSSSSGCEVHSERRALHASEGVLRTKEVKRLPKREQVDELKKVIGTPSQQRGPAVPYPFFILPLHAPRQELLPFAMSTAGKQLGRVGRGQRRMAVGRQRRRRTAPTPG